MTVSEIIKKHSIDAPMFGVITEDGTELQVNEYTIANLQLQIIKGNIPPLKFTDCGVLNTFDDNGNIECELDTNSFGIITELKFQSVKAKMNK
jgi:hypothetical protein